MKMKIAAELWTNPQAKKDDLFLILWDYNRENYWGLRNGKWKRGNKATLVDFGWTQLERQA